MSRTFHIMNISDFIKTALHDEHAIGWQHDLHSFVKTWLNDNDFIEVKTSGSTGLPKLIRHKKKNMRKSAGMTCDFLGLKPGMSALICLSTHNIAGMMMVVRSIERELDILTAAPGSHPLREIPTSKMIDFCAMVPAQVFNSMHDDHDREVLKNIKHLIIGGAPVSYQLKQEIKQLPGNVYSTFGMTETMSHIAMCKMNGPDASDEYSLLEGIRIETGQNGNLIIYAPFVENNPVITNDLVEITSPRTFRWLGRQDHVINSGGFKIFPELVESKIAPVMSKYFNEPENSDESMRSTQRYFISSVPDLKLGEKPVLVIEMSTPENKDILVNEILACLTPILQRHELPRDIFFISKLIQTPTGKIIRSASLKIKDRD